MAGALFELNPLISGVPSGAKWDDCVCTWDDYLGRLRLYLGRLVLHLGRVLLYVGRLLLPARLDNPVTLLSFMLLSSWGAYPQRMPSI